MNLIGIRHIHGLLVRREAEAIRVAAMISHGPY